jgi:hypothetical protein
MPTSQINPLLINLLKHENLKVDDSPTVSMLPGKYAQLIIKNRKSVTPLIEENYHMLTCKSCGRKGKYDVGLLVMNVEEEEAPTGASRHIQMTGYFRCKHCNAAGDWELPSSIYLQSIVGVLPIGSSKKSSVGKSLLFDGSWHLYTTDAEAYLLRKLEENPHDAFVWNRLGNLYNKGNRPELAASVFEHSISVDPSQVESHFTLGDLLRQIDRLPEAGFHFRQMLIHAESYKKLPALKLRNMLANGIGHLFLIHEQTNGDIPFTPSIEEGLGSRLRETLMTFLEVPLEIDPDDVESFFPLAEIYMGNRAKEIPSYNRTLKLKRSSNKASRPKKKKRKKR